MRGCRMPDPHLHPTDPHPPEWQRDLNPNFRAGQNSTMGNAAAGKDWATAFDVKDIHRALGKAFRDDELKAIPIVPTGSPSRRVRPISTWSRGLAWSSPRTLTWLPARGTISS